jgi:hypothetical protein
VAQSAMNARASATVAMCSATALLWERIRARRASMALSELPTPARSVILRAAGANTYIRSKGYFLYVDDPTVASEAITHIAWNRGDGNKAHATLYSFRKQGCCWVKPVADSIICFKAIP